MPTPCCPRSHGVDLTVSSGTGRSGSYEVTLRFSECPREPGLGRVVAGGHCSYSAFYTVPYHCTMALGPDSPPSANVPPCVCVCVCVCMCGGLTLAWQSWALLDFRAAAAQQDLCLMGASAQRCPLAFVSWRKSTRKGSALGALSSEGHRHISILLTWQRAAYCRLPPNFFLSGKTHRTVCGVSLILLTV
jgi:hypothetical protein